VIPAGKKWFARAAIADIITCRIEEHKLEPLKPTKEQIVELELVRKELEAKTPG
jgi:hypothetical protein